MSEPKFKAGDRVRFVIEESFRGMILSSYQHDGGVPKYEVRYGEVRHKGGSFLSTVIDSGTIGLDTVEVYEFELLPEPEPKLKVPANETMTDALLDQVIVLLDDAKSGAVGDCDFDSACDIRDVITRIRQRRRESRDTVAAVKKIEDECSPPPEDMQEE